MITKTKDGYLVSDKNVTIDSTRAPQFKCPKCGCVFWDVIDTFIDKDKNSYACQECGTILEDYTTSPK